MGKTSLDLNEARDGGVLQSKVEKKKLLVVEWVRAPPVRSATEPVSLARSRLSTTSICVRHDGAARREGGSFPLWVDVQKLHNMCLLSLSWNFFVARDKYQTLQIHYALQ